MQRFTWYCWPGDDADDDENDDEDGLESNHFILSLSSALEGGANGKPTITTQRAKPFAKLIPSDIFAPTTQNRTAPLPSLPIADLE